MSLFLIPVHFEGMKVGDDATRELEKGKTLFLTLKHISNVNELGNREVVFELNSSRRVVKIKDVKAGVSVVVRPRVDPLIKGQIGAPMPGVVIAVKVA